MKRFRLFEEFISYDGSGGGKWPGYTEEEKKGEFVVTVVTQEAIDRFKKRYGDKPISARHIGYHLSPVPYKDAVKKQKKLKDRGTYKGEQIKSVHLFERGVIEQGD